MVFTWTTEEGRGGPQADQLGSLVATTTTCHATPAFSGTSKALTRLSEGLTRGSAWQVCGGHFQAAEPFPSDEKTVTCPGQLPLRQYLILSLILYEKTSIYFALVCKVANGDIHHVRTIALCRVSCTFHVSWSPLPFVPKRRGEVGTPFRGAGLKAPLTCGGLALWTGHCDSDRGHVELKQCRS